MAPDAVTSLSAEIRLIGELIPDRAKGLVALHWNWSRRLAPKVNSNRAGQSMSPTPPAVPEISSG
jgi:hypothetical protein